MNTWQQPLAFTDVETTGADPTIYEITEIGLVLVEQESKNVLKEFSVKVQPEHPEIFEQFALHLTEYSKEGWKDALDLKSAIEQYAELTQNTIFCSWRVAFDFDFMRHAFRTSAIRLSVDPQTQICVYTMARFAFRNKKIDPFHSKQVCKALGIEDEPLPHRALNGARKAFEIYQRLNNSKSQT